MPETTLHAQLTEIAELEKKHNLLGVSFSAKDNSQAIRAEEAVEYVREVILRTVEILDKRDDIPLVPPKKAI